MHIEEIFSFEYFDNWKEKEMFFLLKNLGKEGIYLIQRKAKERLYDFFLESLEGDLVLKLGEYEPEGKKSLRCSISFTGDLIHYNKKIRNTLFKIISDFYKEEKTNF